MQTKIWGKSQGGEQYIDKGVEVKITSLHLVR